MQIENENNNTLLYDEKLEQQLLGCILINNRVLQYIELDLSDKSFYFEQNKTIYKAICSLLQNNRQADEQTLYYSLMDNDAIQLKNDELKKYLSGLIMSGAGAISSPKEIVKILNFLQLKRQLALFNKDINNTISNSSMENIEEQIGNLEQQIYNITNEQKEQDSYRQLGKYTAILKEKLNKARKSDKSILGVKTGLNDMDNYTGGFQKSDLIIIAARPSMGKTALATTIAKNIATIARKEAKTKEEMQSVAMFSLEMSGEQLAARIVAMDSKFNTKTIHTGRYDEKDVNGLVIEANKKISDAEWNKIQQSMDDVGNIPLYIDDTPALNISVLRSRARYMKNRYNICAIIIDYLQLLKPSRNVGGNRVLELAEITGTLKAIAKELDIPVIALSQLSRAVEGSDRKDKRPQLSDLRESGTIEQDADIVMLLYREEYYLSRQEPKITDPNDDIQVGNYEKWFKKYEQVKNIAEVIVAKNRNGPVGTIVLSFDREHMLFSGYDKYSANYDNFGHKQIPNDKNTNNDNIKQLEAQYQIHQQNGNMELPQEFNNDNEEIPDDLKDVFG